MLLPEGLIPASFSPFTDDDKLDTRALDERLEEVCEGASGLHGPANHSEMTLLTFEEWKQWIDVMIDVCKRKKLKSWAFFGAESFKKTIPFAEYAVEAGADGFILLPPYKVKYSAEAAYQYFKDFAKLYPKIPIIFYGQFNTPNPSDPYLAARIAEIPNMVGMKLTSEYTIMQVGTLYSLTRNNKHFRIVAGSLAGLYVLRGLDIKASFSVQSELAPKWALELWRALQNRDWKTADHWFDKLNELSHAMNNPGGYLHSHAGEKAAMALLGKPVGRVRSPALPPTDEQLAVIKKALAKLGLM